MSAISRPASRLAGLAFAFAAVFAAAFAAPAVQAQTPTGTPHLMLTLEDGVVDIELLPALAPKHVERIVTLANEGFYDGVVFHRVIDGFMAQTGDPTGTGMGGSDYPDLQAEFTNAESFQRGVLGMARSQDPNSANSQFFITYADASFLDGQYTIFGKVVSGMEFVDALEKGPESANGQVENPDKIVSAKVEYR
ncbi:peptidylprolyl isomerase [Devosia limi DSM 17137]|uniref:Peptidyl-prolyl cis-trans isomerase n=1 Tax=Devosia limi DSM 17137 TaxID=1121477 RepID=A0A0F5LKE4_9HYPH|nr:peptidylprolyl isomerase [Devosia limi]KKB82901.1 peptidylprolyl isomerase [Devosia limi DSM 17137]SHF50717.1 peptidylprolyl isomerase [Devosia limi DSM 17137]